MRVFFVLTVSLSLLSTACSRLETLSLDGEKVAEVPRYSDFVDKVEYVVLNPVGGVKLGRIMDLERTPSYIFVISQGTDGVLQFDMEGHLVRRIPMPATDKASSLAVDNENRLLLVGYGSGMHIFNFAGRHLRNVRFKSADKEITSLVPGFVCKMSVPSSDDINAAGYNFAEVINYNDSLFVKLTQNDTLLKGESTDRFFRLNTPLLHDIDGKGSIALLSPLSDTLFMLDKESVKPLILIDRGNDRSYRDAVSGIMPRRLDPKWRHIESMMMTPTCLWLKVSYNDSVELVVFNRETSDTERFKPSLSGDDYLSHSRLFVNDYDGGIGAWGDYSLSDGTHAAVIYPSEIEEFRHKGDLDSIKTKALKTNVLMAERNPMVMFIWFK